MDLHELRYGNFIYWDIPEKQNVIHGVVGIKNGKPLTIPISLGDSIYEYKPIPLTEKWLLDFGWLYQDRDVNRGDKVKERFYISPYFGKHREYWLELQLKESTRFNHSFLWFNWNIGGGRNFVHLPNGDKMFFVHELQNLFYSLAGTELVLQERGVKV